MQMASSLLSFLLLQTVLLFYKRSWNERYFVYFFYDRFECVALDQGGGEEGAEEAILPGPRGLGCLIK